MSIGSAGAASFSDEEGAPELSLSESVSKTSKLASPAAQATTYSIIYLVCISHFINDVMQATLPALFPLIKTSFGLTFAQIGAMTFVTQVTASLLQPAVGIYTDRRPLPWLMPAGMVSTVLGVIALAFAPTYAMLLVACGLIGIGSSTFHPEASRIARMASGGRFGFAQSTFQFGGNAGTALGPLIAATLILPFGRERVAVHVLFLIVGIFLLWKVSRWYAANLVSQTVKKNAIATHGLSKSRIIISLVLLASLVFSKNVYSSSLVNYFAFFLMERFELSAPQAQLYLFLYLGAAAVGTLIGGPIGDKVGRKRLIWFSVLGAAPFTMVLPYANLFWTGVLAVVIGLIVSSAFSAIVVFAQELLPTHVGLVAGIFFGLAFGFAGISAGFLGRVADLHGVNYVFWLTSFMPLIGIVAAFLPNIHRKPA